MNKNYCISSLNALKSLPHLDTAQITLNSRLFPSKRNTVQNLRDLAPWYENTDLIVHYDYIYIISRFAYLTEEVQNAIINECIAISNYAAENPRIKGIVMHTDFPIRRECYVKGVDHQKITDAYTSSLWNPSSIHSIVDEGSNLDQVLARSITTFYNKFVLLNQGPIGCKVYLENTVHIGPDEQGSLPWIRCFLNNHPELKDLFGICWDWEHEAAISGKKYTIPERLDLLSSLGDCIVHMNCIPADAPLGAGKDKHSYNTIFECTEYSSDYYSSLSDHLTRLCITFVREVKEETMNREIEQCNGSCS